MWDGTLVSVFVMMWCICRCLKKRRAWVYRRLILRGESHSLGTAFEKSKFKSIFGSFLILFLFGGGGGLMLMQATSSHTHGNTHWCARVCLLWLVFPVRAFAILFQGHSLHFWRCGGVPIPPSHPTLPHPVLSSTISQALTSRGAVVCFKASN